MFQSYGTQVTCPNCRNPFTVQLEQVIDVARDPGAKARFLAGRLNVINCPNCNYPSRLSAPIIYHDQSKEMLITYVPMELGLPRVESDRVTGALVNAVVNQIPTEQRRGYLLMPKTAFTLQGMMETILEADGITKEMLEARREKVRIAEKMLTANPDEWPTLVEENKDKIDREFFELVTASAESALGAGNRPAAEAMLALRDFTLQNTEAGRALMAQSADLESIIRDVEARVAGLGQNVTREQMVDLILQLALEDQGDPLSAQVPQRLAVFVSMAANALDQTVFEIIKARAETAADADRLVYESAYAYLLQSVNTLNAESEASMRSAAELLSMIVNSDDTEAAIRSRLESIDELFMAVLQANVQSAEAQKDMASAARLKSIYEQIMVILAESTPPAVGFINSLIEMEPKAASMEIALRADEFGADLLQWFDLLLEQFSANPNGAVLVQRLSQLRSEAVRALNNSSPNAASEQASGQNVLSFGQARGQLGGRNTPGNTSNVNSSPLPKREQQPSAPPTAPAAQGNNTPDTNSDPNKTASGLVLPFTRKKKSE